MIPPATLRERAESGDAVAQLAWSLVLRHGLHGVKADPTAADDFRRLAAAPRGQTQVLQYTAAVNGAAARTEIINIPNREITRRDDAQANECINALKSGIYNNTSYSQACGTENEYYLLVVIWLEYSPKTFKNE